MNKIVIEHYPVSRLPEDLRAGLETAGSVRVTVESEAAADKRPRGPSIAELAAQLKALSEDPTRVITTPEEAVRRIRELRDEWDD